MYVRANAKRVLIDCICPRKDARRIAPGQERVAKLSGQLGNSFLPRFISSDATPYRLQQRISHSIQQSCLAREMPVEGRRLYMQRLRELAHRQAVQPHLIQEFEGFRDDLLPDDFHHVSPICA